MAEPRMTDDLDSLPSEALLAARQDSRGTIALGAMLVCMGIFAIISPLFSGLATAVLVGLLLIAAGLVESFYAFQAPSFGKAALRMLFGGLSVLAGVFVVSQPGDGLGLLTMILAGYFVIGGIVDIALAFGMRPQEGWGWTLASGLVSILLGVLIIAKWPVSGVWAVGVLVGIRLLMHGWMLMALATAGRDLMVYAQLRRLERLEDHVRTGLAALQETQVALGGVAAALVVLGARQETKVSVDDVDPAIVEINDLLGKARGEMQRTEEAASEAWDGAQSEANEAFGELQAKAGSLIERMRKELGLDQG